MTDKRAVGHHRLTETVANLRAGLRLATGQPLPAAAFTCSIGHVLFVLALGWLAVVAEQRLSVGAGASFWIWGFIAEAAKNHLWVAALALVAWLTARPQAFITLLIALAWASLPIWLAARGMQQVAAQFVPDLEPRYADLFLWSVLAWQCAVFWRALGLIAPLGGLRAAAGLALYAAAIVTATKILPDSPMFYLATEEPTPLDIESIYYDQPALVQAALDTLAAEDPKRIELYFLGVGAFAEQDVFMREVQAVRAIVERRLDGRGRSLVLVNNPRTVEALPLANRHNLERAIHGIADRMNRSQDILLLFLTSHGYEDASIAVDFEPLGMGDLYASDIRAMLDGAGILWRVVIVSACYSGSFVDALRGPTTVVMTASAADRSSFGCSAENAWTYFGRAYFAEALDRTRDLIEAFELARRTITARETAEDKESSQPQIWVGERIADQLREWRAEAPDQPSVSR